MRMYDIILKKREGHELSKEEIEFFVDGFTRGHIPDYQASALLMAIFFKKMNEKETKDLTMSMVNSGEIIDLSSIEGIKVDKHSTGGVGDTTTLVLGPMVASLGVPVAKMSGRGLGHTGGTIDKLESIEGFNVNMDRDTFIKNVNDRKIVIGAQTGNLVPADKKLYALRDLTATVEDISLIASSIMSKKIASGADAIVLDIKLGEGAFMKTESEAKKLAEAMVSIGKMVNKKVVAVISDMDQPLGYAVGNALEVKEAIDTLKGIGPLDLTELCLTLGSYMVILAGKAKDKDEARQLLKESISSGRAFLKFKEFIAAQGGNIDFVMDCSKMHPAKYIIEVKSDREGFISKIHAEGVGLIAMKLGAGRITKESIIDLSVGVVLNKKRGDRVFKNDILAYIHASDLNIGNELAEELLNCFIINEKYLENVPLIYDIIR